MRAAIQDSLRKNHGRKVRPSAVGVASVPTDDEAMKIVRQLADEACEGASSGMGFFPGSYRASAITRYGLGLGAPNRNGTAPGAEAANIYERFRAAADAHPESGRLRRAIFLAIVAHQAYASWWSQPQDHYIGAGDSNFVRTCQVAAARMLSQKKLWQVVRRPDNRAGLIRVDWPDSFWG
jgi:hypothetical protein